MTTQPAANARLAAARALGDVLDRQLAPEGDWLQGESLAPRDRAFARHLVYGVLRWLSALEWLAGQMLARPLKKRDRDLELLILLGLFQLWKGETQPHAAVHATVEAASELGKPWATGLINAVLRNFQRRREGLLETLGRVPERHAHPDWLLDALQTDWPSDWEAIVAANNSQPPLWLRVNRQRTDRPAYSDMLAGAGLDAIPSAEAPDAVRVEPAVPVADLPGFDQGLVSVQDAAAQLAAHYLDAQPGQRVLDACAAPGGKTCHLLECTPGLRVTALDRDAARTALIRDNLRRLGLQCEVIVGDATNPGDWWDKQNYDRILLDAPCSATGVIRRHPEIKWLRSARQTHNAVERQQALLEALWPLLKPGGILVYATCSILKCENSQQILEFQQRHPGAGIAPAPTGAAQPAAGRQILPGQQDMDGFFYACLHKPA